MVNLPNGITVFRIFMVPVAVWLIISGNLQFAFIVFVLAGLSDGLDGYLAKTYGSQTTLGAYLDPIADKALLVSIFISLGYFSYLPAWLVVAVVSRDILIVGAFILSWILSHPIDLKPLMISKANTLSQILLAALVLANEGFGLGLWQLVEIAIWVTGALTVSSAAIYLVTWLRHMAASEPTRSQSQAPAQRPGKSGPRRPGDATPRP